MTDKPRGDQEAPDVQLWQRWRQGERPDVVGFLAGFPALNPTEQVAVLLLDQRERWQVGERVPAESYLRRFAALESNAEDVVELAYGEYLLREESGEWPSLDEYLWRFPDHQARLRLQVELHQALRGTAASTNPSQAASATGLLSVPGYEVVRELGRGSMGVVYLARQTGLNRVVAFKMILSGGHAGAEERARFLAEAEAVARVKHPGIVQVYDFGTHDGLPFFSLEFCEGGSLAARLAQHPLPSREAALLVERVARAVQAAHEAAIVHRDLKPGNILLDGEGRPKVTDFGLAKRIEAGASLTATGAIVGTPSYMAPEQAQGKKVGPAADVYALGASLYECLTGRPPFRAATPFDTILQVVGDEPVPPRQLNPQVPRDLETVCLKCLQKDPKERYASAQALGDDLVRWLAGEPIVARPARRLERALKWMRRRPAAASLLGVSVLAALGLAVLSVVAVWQWRTAVIALAQREEARRKEVAERAQRALAQVDTLLTADPRAVPPILERLSEQRADVLPRLRQVWDQPDTPRSRPHRLRAALALLPVEPRLVRADLERWLLEVADPAELLLVRDAVRPFAEELRAGLWRRLEQQDTSPKQQLRLLAALAAFDPKGPGWQKVDEKALETWLADNPLYLGAWTTALWPARAQLLAPLSRIFREGAAERRPVAASILADYARDRPRTLAELIVEADDRQFATLLPALRPHRETVVPLLAREGRRRAPATATEAAREALARRQAGAGLALARLGEAEQVWSLLAHSPYPETRTRLTLRLGPVGVDVRLLAERLKTEKDVSVRRALVLSLGEYTPEQMPVELRQRLVGQLLVWYRQHPDPGFHGAIDWLLRHDQEGREKRPLAWQQGQALRQIDDELAAARHARRAGALAGRIGMAAGGLPLASAAPEWLWQGERDQGGRNWYVNGQGQTLTLIDTRQPFLMGSPEDEAGRFPAEKQHWRRIGRRYAIGTKPLTVAQFQRFLKANPKVEHDYPKRYSPDADGPIIYVTWYEAAQYSRWLSEVEGVPEREMVYPPVAEIENYKDGTRPLPLPADYLNRKGYRLPTEAEWEFACRAGARSSRYYGSAVELLPRYAWYLGNAQDRTWPVGQKRPNDLGLFDMHGNVWEWCQESGWEYPSGSLESPVPDAEDKQGVADKLSRVLRCAGFGDRPAAVRAALRVHDRPTNRRGSVGFRVARTCD